MTSADRVSAAFGELRSARDTPHQSVTEGRTGEHSKEVGSVQVVQETTLLSFFHLCCKIRPADSMAALGGSQVEGRGLSLRGAYAAVTPTRAALIQVITMNSLCHFYVCIGV